MSQTVISPVGAGVEIHDIYAGDVHRGKVVKLSDTEYYCDAALSQNGSARGTIDGLPNLNGSVTGMCLNNNGWFSAPATISNGVITMFSSSSTINQFICGSKIELDGGGTVTPPAGDELSSLTADSSDVQSSMNESTGRATISYTPSSFSFSSQPTATASNSNISILSCDYDGSGTINVTWESNRQGSTTVTVNAGGRTAQFTVTVSGSSGGSEEVRAIHVQTDPDDTSSPGIAVGDTVTAYVTYDPSSYSGTPDISYDSSVVSKSYDSGVSNGSQTLEFTGETSGSTNVRISAGSGAASTFEITVTGGSSGDVSDIEWATTTTSHTVTIGKTITLAMRYPKSWGSLPTPSMRASTSGYFTWGSWTDDYDGMAFLTITGQKTGLANFYVTVNGTTIQCDITVTVIDVG